MNWVWNWPAVVVMIFIVVMAFVGWRKGFVKMALSALSVVLAIILMCVFGSMIRDGVKNHTNIDEKLTNKIVQIINDHTEIGDKTEDVIDKLHLPAIISDKLKDSAGNITGNTRSVAAKLANMIVSIMVYVVLFIVILILEAILVKLMDLITKLPVIHQMNGLLGMVVSLLEAWVILCVIFLVLTTFVQSEWGRNLLAMIRENPLTCWLYDHNILLIIAGR